MISGSRSLPITSNPHPAFHSAIAKRNTPTFAFTSESDIRPAGMPRPTPFSEDISDQLALFARLSGSGVAFVMVNAITPSLAHVKHLA